MPTFPIRLAALDLDGTLLSHHSEVTPRTRQALANAAARGVAVVPATGRPLANLPLLVAGLPGVRYALTSNGAAVWDLGADPAAAVRSRYANAGGAPTAEPVCVYRGLLPVETAREAFALFEEYEGAMSVFSAGRAIRTPEDMRRFAARLARRRSSTEALQPDDGRFTVVRSHAEWMSRHAHEVEKFCMFFDTAAEAQAALPRFRALAGVEVVQGSPDNIEVTAAGVDKGTGLLALAKYLGVPQAATLAVGDSENDLAMLRKAGLAAAMANGMPLVKQTAALVSEADCDHDGVAELFQKLGIG